MANNFNEEYVKGALNEGIDGEAVRATLTDILNRSDELGSTPMQIKKSIETVVNMKVNTQNKTDDRYLSDLVKENSEKIKSALNDGISSEEVTHALIGSINGKKDNAKFVARLITTMKNKELILKNKLENEKSYQKTMTMKNVA